MGIDRQHNQSRPPACSWWKRGAQINGIGRSRGGLSTKVHLLVDALGLPLDFEITEGQTHDVTQAPALIERNAAEAFLADKAYDSDAVREQITNKGSVAVIPNKANRSQPALFDRELYKARSDIELMFNRFKQWRRFATRFDKTKRNYAAFVSVCCSMAWLN